jgi:hypothetical protein
MTLALSKERKTILIIGAILLMVAAFYRFQPQLTGIFTTQEDSELKEQKIFRLQRLIKKKTALEREFKALNASLKKAEKGLLSSKTTALAAVDIQNLLKKMAERQQAEIIRMRVLDPIEHTEIDYLGIPVQITVRSTIRQLKNTLYQIANNKSLLHVTNLRINAVRGKKDYQIQSTMTVEGFMTRG